MEDAAPTHESPLTPGLYLVGTPIGNLEDLTLRARRVLDVANAVFAEDTRITRRLMDRHGLRAPLISCHKFNEARRVDMIADRIRAGGIIALVTDAGMPGVSDPGSRVADAVRSMGLPVAVVPGPCSVSAALALSGFGGGAYSFGAFLPRKQGARTRQLAALLSRGEPVVLFESPFRIARTLQEIAALDPARPVCVARELTKHFEETRRGRADELAAHWATRSPKGEFVIVIGPAGGAEVSSVDEGEEDSVIRDP
jgi:16S rRNA (cytidine1402-2'-O)-methyltransferase